MHKKLLFLSLIPLGLICTSFGEGKRTSADAHLNVRRIVEYWKEGDFATAKRQIIDFFKLYPETEFNDELNAMLGDLYFQENAFNEALQAYAKIQKDEFKEKIFLNFLQSHFELRHYDDVIENGTLFLKQCSPANPLSEKVRFLFAEAASKYALETDDLERKEELARLSKPHHQLLLNTRYKDFSLTSLAEAHTILKEYQEAASCFEKLSSIYPEKEEDLLFEVALLQQHFDVSSAIETYKKIAKMGKARASDAAYNRMVLYFREEKYNALLQNRDELYTELDKELLSDLDFFVGKSYCYLDENEKALTPLLNYIASQTESSAQLKNAIISTAICAEKVSNLETLSRVVNAMRGFYPNDAEFASLLLAQARLSNAKNDFPSAKQSLEEVLALFPNHPDQEKILYDYALILTKEGSYCKGRQTFSEFLSLYPESERASNAWKQLLNCSIKDLNSASEESLTEKKERCVSDMFAILDQKNVLSENERARYQYLIAKNYYELKNYADTIIQLEKLIRENPQHENIAEAYLLLAMARLEGESDWSGFVVDAKKALSLNPNLPEKQLIHLHLYNAYLELSEQNESSKDEYTDLAADHLLQSFYSQNVDIKLPNLLWLANYYNDHFQEYKKQHPEYKKKSLTSPLPYIDQALDVYENLFSRYSVINENELFLEEEMIKFTQLLEIKNQLGKKQSYLEAITQNQKENPTFHWKFQRHLLFELGKTYEMRGITDQALATYNELIESSSHIASYHANAAELHKNKILLSQLSSEELEESNLKVLSILNSLKNLQIKKKLHSEPIHLEAALEYIDLKTNLTRKEERDEKALTLYHCFLDDFSTQNDPISTDYQSARCHFPEKDRIIDNYLTFAEMQIHFIQSELAKKHRQKDMTKKHEKSALELLAKLQGEDLPEYLHKRINNIVKRNDA